MANNSYEVRDKMIEAKLKEIGRMIGESLPSGQGFALQIFDFGDGGNLFYISNAQREDLIRVLEKDFIPRLKAGGHVG